MNPLGFPVLSVIVFLPLLGGLSLWLLRKEDHASMRWMALGVTGAVLVLTVLVVVTYKVDVPTMQFVEYASWMPALGVTYRLGVDGISLYLLPLTALLFVIAVFSSWQPVGHTDEARQAVRSYLFWLLLLETGVLGVFVALDLVLFYVFWEAMLVPAYFLIGRWGGSRRAQATTKFFIYTMAGSALMLVGILLMGFFNAQQTGALTFDWMAMRELRLAWPVSGWLFLMFALAFAVKVPIFPFHTWLPEAYGEAPAPVTMVLAGVLSKMGIYGFLRLCLPLFPEAVRVMGPWVAVLAVVGILYASLAALAQRDVKLVIAYSSVAHLSLVVLGVFLMNTLTLAGVVIQMVSHGIYVAALFLIVDMLERRRGSRAIADFGGLWKATPVLGICFLIAMLGAIGLPGLNGFVGEFTILAGVFQRSRWFAAMAALGMILGAWYMLWTYQRVMHGKLTDTRLEKVGDITSVELIAVVPLLVLIFVIGIVPNVVLLPANPTVIQLAKQITVLLPQLGM